jgi:hypothetical protein
MRRLGLLIPAALLAGFFTLAPVAPVAPACAAAGAHHAALVVEHGDGSVVGRCVGFDTATITGEELLNRSGLAWSSQTFGGFGDAVCALDGEPAHYLDCLGKDRYWAVFVARAGGSWQLANVGISTLTIHDGDAEGLRFDPASGVPAAPASPAGVCAAPAATATPAPRRSVASGAASAAPSTTATGASAATGAATAAATAIGTPPPAAPVVATATEPAAPPRSPSPTPAPPGGVDPGLLLTAGVGGGLAGLAILRLIARRRPPAPGPSNR